MESPTVRGFLLTIIDYNRNNFDEQIVHNYLNENLKKKLVEKVAVK